MWFLLPIAGLGGLVAWNRFHEKGGVKGLAQRSAKEAIDGAKDEIVKQAKQVYKTAIESGLDYTKAKKAVTTAVKALADRIGL